MTTLQVITRAYRATYEEQDDTILWLTQAIAAAGARVAILLRSNAVNYALREQRAPALAIGTWRQSNPPAIADDLARIVAAGVPVYAIREDAEERGLREDDLAEGVALVRRCDVAGLVDRHDRVWMW
jgi:sulfur transfer complex TusBCD TusB component (DsrH family)